MLVEYLKHKQEQIRDSCTSVDAKISFHSFTRREITYPTVNYNTKFTILDKAGRKILDRLFSMNFLQQLTYSPRFLL